LTSEINVCVLALLFTYSGVDFTKFLNISLVGLLAKKRKLCEEKGGESNNNHDDEKVENEIETAVPAPDLGVGISKSAAATSTEIARPSFSKDLAQDDCNENDIGRSSFLSYEKKTELKKCWTPPKTYDVFVVAKGTQITLQNVIQENRKIITLLLYCVLRIPRRGVATQALRNCKGLLQA